MKTLRLLSAALAFVLATVAAPFSTSAHAQALTDFAENRLIDAVFRGQSLGAPATFYVALFTAASACDAATVTEVSGGSYARVAVTSSLANWAGTQSAGSTTASSGTGGQTSNNGSISFPAPTANWGTVTHFGLYSASSGGDLWICQALATSKTVNASDAAPAFNAGALTVTFQ